MKGDRVGYSPRMFQKGAGVELCRIAGSMAARIAGDADAEEMAASWNPEEPIDPFFHPLLNDISYLTSSDSAEDLVEGVAESVSRYGVNTGPSMIRQDLLEKIATATAHRFVVLASNPGPGVSRFDPWVSDRLSADESVAAHVPDGRMDRWITYRIACWLYARVKDYRSVTLEKSFVRQLELARLVAVTGVIQSDVLAISMTRIRRQQEDEMVAAGVLLERVAATNYFPSTGGMVSCLSYEMRNSNPITHSTDAVRQKISELVYDAIVSFPTLSTRRKKSTPFRSG
jgi:hypothetical protein